MLSDLNAYGKYRFGFIQPKALGEDIGLVSEITYHSSPFWRLALKRVYVDTSSTQYAVKPHQIRELIDIFGIHHVIFGSDYPIFNAGDELKRFENIPMTEEEKECIFHGNIERLLLKYKTNS